MDVVDVASPTSMFINPFHSMNRAKESVTFGSELRSNEGFAIYDPKLGIQTPKREE